MSFWDHLEEFRWMVLRCIAVLLVATGAGFAFTSATYGLLRRPLMALDNQVELVFSGPLDAFLIRLKLAVLTGVVLAVPFILAFIWRFVAPGLRAREKTVIWGAVAMGTVFFGVGALFGYYLLFFGLPALVRLGISGPGVRHLWSLKSYMDFCFRFILAFGVVFEFPVVTVALARLGLLEAATLRRIRPYAVIGIFVLAAFITPPDPVTQVMLGLPLLVLYEASIVVTGFMERSE
ncbi:MAG: twin-arginine translocase subunit TatC [Candidatus Pacebacteria bacterium]|nr:twin-arginine translocase subunit TatC [Candidatus Paceibacterota bacterium]